MLKPSLNLNENEKDRDSDPSWEELLANKPKQQHKQTPKGRQVPPSVIRVCEEVDAAIKAGEYLMEERFYQMDETPNRQPTVEHLPKTLAAFSLHQSFCLPCA